MAESNVSIEDVAKAANSAEFGKSGPQLSVSRFRQWLRSFGRKAVEPKQAELPQSSATDKELTVVKENAFIEKPVEDEKQGRENPRPRITDIATILTEKLDGKNDYIPHPIDSGGVLAIGGTNETISGGFFEVVRSKNPDGYIVGVGAGNVFTLVNCFPDGTLPKGIILADIDPAVVAVGKLIIRKLHESSTFEEFDRVHDLSETEFVREVKETISEEGNDILAKRLASLTGDSWTRIWRYVSQPDKYMYKNWNPEKYDGTQFQGTPINTNGAMKEKFSTLKQLAEEGNITITYADFTNPTFIAAVKNLPEFSDSANIIYISNIIDHITSRGRQFENVEVMETLKGYENSVRPPVFIDTLQSLNYFLRVRNTLPVYTHEDVIMPMPKGGFKPEGLFFADN